MGYRVYSFSHKRHHDSEADEFFEAAEKARRAVEKMHDLATEMEDRYSERYYGMRDHDWDDDRYSRRDRYDWDDDMMHERRRRDSRGRYM